MSPPNEAGFEYIHGNVSTLGGYNTTTVDIIAVPCVGASPVDTWGREPLPHGYFTFPSATDDNDPAIRQLPGSVILNPAFSSNPPAASSIWVRHGIRAAVSTARVLLYRHCQLHDGLTLDQLADDLLEIIWREGQPRVRRPLFFICHSIGGLIVKKALTKATQRQYNDDKYKWIFQNCHGITFFGTPHFGSEYLSMPSLRIGVQHTLFLEGPLPLSLTRDLRLFNPYLLELHTSFIQIAGDIRVWSFYEAIDTQLSGLDSGTVAEVFFSAPLVPVQSALLGTKHEQVSSLASDHASCASFGRENRVKLHHYLSDLGQAVRRAEDLAAKYMHTPLVLSRRVKVELTAVYENADPRSTSNLIYNSRHSLDDFFSKGLEACFQERLDTISPRPRARSRPSRGVTEAYSDTPHVASETSDRPVDLETSRRLSDLGTRPSQHPGALAIPEIRITPTSTPDNIAPGPGLTNPNIPAASADIPGGPIAMSANAPEIGIVETEENSYPDSKAARRYLLQSTSMLKDESPAGLSAPDPHKRKYQWIHVPFNNPRWIREIFASLSAADGRDYPNLLLDENWQGGSRMRNSQPHAPNVKPGCGFEGLNTQDPTLGREPNPNTPSHLYLYLPYLHYDTYIAMVRRRRLLLRRLHHGRTYPVPLDIAEQDSLELRVIWGEVGNELPLNIRRTLDQYGQPWLKDTSARDDNQMLYKLTRESRVAAAPPKNRQSTSYNPVHNMRARRSVEDFTSVYPGSSSIEDKLDYEDELDDDLEHGLLNGKVLVVDQLWLWAFETTKLTTFFPERESNPTDGTLFQVADLRNSIHNQLSGTVRCENALDLAALVTLHAVTILLDQNSHPDLEVFRIFEEAIGIMSERMTSSLRRFRIQAAPHLMPITDVSAETAEKERVSIEKRQERELEQAERMNREDTSVLLELRDADDELTTLSDLFTEQSTIIETMRENYLKPELVDMTRNGVLFLNRALARLAEYKKQASDMKDRIDTVRKDYQTLLEMMQRVDDVRFSRLQTELARTQNRTLLIFTSFTVLFLPLSFFTSLFGMNTQEWGGGDNISLKVIGAISLPASTLLILTGLTVALSTRVQSAMKDLLKPLVLQAHTWRTKLRTPMLLRRRRRTRATERLDEMPVMRRSRARDDDYDFWESVRTQKADRYVIPETNRKRR
ncbi:hypothetical protein F4777DRAFT_575884 [Nemania sp. FL0916]|nr:hypothetical protein F4777DRAFT_575884 [Nemania sp. FL0916]